MFSIKQHYFQKLRYRTYFVSRKEYQNEFYSIPSINYNDLDLNFDNLKHRMEELYENQDTEESLHKQYYTKSKEHIMRTLVNHAHFLMDNEYRDFAGTNSTLLSTPNGIGKSTTLLSSCIVLSSMKKNLIPIYLQFNYKHVLLSEAIVKNLKQEILKPQRILISMIFAKY